MQDLSAAIDELLGDLPDEERAPEADDIAARITAAVDLVAVARHRTDHEGELLLPLWHLLERALALADAVRDRQGAIRSALARAERLHRDVAAATTDRRRELAEHLHRFQQTDTSGTFDGAFARYAPIFGSEGAARYRELLAGQVAAIARTVSPSSPPRPTSPPARQTTLSFTPEAPFEQEYQLRRSNLDSPRDYVDLVRFCRRRGRPDLALEWARRGRDTFPGADGATLAREVVDLLTAQGSGEELIGAIEDLLTRRPRLEHLRRLRATTSTVWREGGYRERALQILRDAVVDEEARRDPEAEGAVAARRELLRALAEEGEFDEAWEIAIAWGCENELWGSIARGIARSRPEDALAIHMAQIDELEEKTDRTAYEEIVWHLRQMRSLLITVGRPEELEEFVQDLLTRHRRRRTLVALIEDFQRAPMA